MCKARVFWLVCLWSTVCLVQAADADKWITLDNHQVHPTRVLAKFNGGARATLSAETARQTGSKVHKRYTLVPGLAVLEESGNVALANVPAGDEQTKRTRLLNRIDALKKSGLFEYVEPDYIVHAYLTPDD